MADTNNNDIEGRFQEVSPDPGQVDEVCDPSGDLSFHDVARGRFVALSDGMVFGRNSGQEQFQDDKLMSREHCRIRFKRDGVYIEDMGSSNATRINQKPILAGDLIKIKRDDIIEIGSQRFVITSRAKPESQS